MLSTTDFEKLLFLYKTEGKNRFIQTMSVNNDVIKMKATVTSMK
jgi:hypothetical protein